MQHVLVLHERPGDVSVNNICMRHFGGQDVYVRPVTGQFFRVQNVCVGDICLRDVSAEDVRVHDVRVQDLRLRDVPLQQVRLPDLYVGDTRMQRVSVLSVWVHHFRA